MNKLLMTTAVFMASLSTMAHAADLPVKKAAPEPEPPLEWRGFYFGVNAGYDWSITNTVQQTYLDTLPGGFATNAVVGNVPGLAAIRSQEFIGGGQVGWNWQFGKRFLFGFEADIQGLAGGAGSVSFISPTTAAFFSKTISDLGTVRARLGYLINPNFLVYGTGGLAYGQGTLQSSYYGNWVASLALLDYQTSTLPGYTVGGGAEWRFLPQWSVKAEYLYTTSAQRGPRGSNSPTRLVALRPFRPPSRTRASTAAWCASA